MFYTSRDIFSWKYQFCLLQNLFASAKTKLVCGRSHDPFGSGGSNRIFMSKQCYIKNLKYYIYRLSTQNINQIKYFECLEINQLSIHILSYQHCLTLFHNLKIRRSVLGLSAQKWMKKVKTNPQRTQKTLWFSRDNLWATTYRNDCQEKFILYLYVQFWLAKETSRKKLKCSSFMTV